uniref:PulJ/GspJ family protein n=1 Tax=uncultured Allobacillus sp. TaxID=1638025 RepID=UPI002596391E|nr:prepilin-type N-terminal cleavage/methylation domain-containing protein [uncultured Allobacillus sp.]
MNNKYFNEKGFTLLEVILFFLILLVISMIAWSIYNHIIHKSEAKVCEENRYTLHEQYSQELELQGLEHTETHFLGILQTFKVICPTNGVISFSEGQVICDKHHDEGERQDENPEEVPYL